MNYKKFIRIFLLVLIVIGIGLLLTQKMWVPRLVDVIIGQENIQTIPPASPLIVGNDKDEHGCISSAGYSWCAVKNKCLRVWEEKCETSPIQKPITCTPNWKCGWESCNNGYQGMIAVDSNNCGLPSTNVNIACPALARICDSSTQTSERVTKKVGEKEFNFLIQKINTNSIDGLMYTLYPVAMLQGKTQTLHLGDTVGYSCEGKTAILSNIDVINRIVIFNETIKNAPPGGCPI